VDEKKDDVARRVVKIQRKKTLLASSETTNFSGDSVMMAWSDFDAAFPVWSAQHDA
jgi:hypothetical protein